MGLVALAAVIIFLLNSDLSSSFPYLFLIPWLLALGFEMAIPMLYLWRRGEFSIANPLIFGTLSYLFPAFVIGGMLFATGVSQPPFAHFITDADITLTFTAQMMMLGYGGLAIGFLLPVGRKLGEFGDRYLPAPNYRPSRLRKPSTVLLLIGVANSILSLALGLFGFQRGAEIGAFDGIIFLTTLFWLEGSFILCYILFTRGKFDSVSYLIIAIVGSTSLLKALFAGNRGSLIQIFIFIVMSYVLSGRKFTRKQFVFGGLAMFVALIFGTIYGTTFREMKGGEEQMSAEKYTETVVNTVGNLSANSTGSVLSNGFAALAERIDTFSSVGVVVANYERLAPYEESYGLDNNITKDLTTFFIPRVVWPDKPVASEPRRYSELYFDWGENSFAITPIADLLRNFGVYGVFIGMFILGILLRFLYRALVEKQPRNVLRACVFFMLLTAVNYESFYGFIIPFLFKVGTTAIVGVALVILMARLSGTRTLPRGVDAVAADAGGAA